jgi:hypothetical protein
LQPIRLLAALAACAVLVAGGDARAAVSEKVRLAFSRALPNAPGKMLTAIVVEYEPGAAS